MKLLENEVWIMLIACVIEPSISKWNSMIFMGMKKDGMSRQVSAGTISEPLRPTDVDEMEIDEASFKYTALSTLCHDQLRRASLGLKDVAFCNMMKIAVVNFAFVGVYLHVITTSRPSTHHDLFIIFRGSYHVKGLVFIG